jgi:hypothetical protein
LALGAATAVQLRAVEELSGIITSSLLLRH